MKNQKIRNLLGNTSDKVRRFFTKKWIEFMINLEKLTILTRK